MSRKIVKETRLNSDVPVSLLYHSISVLAKHPKVKLAVKNANC